MGFVMTHLAVARKLHEKLGFVRNLPAYYLGSISPDRVHVRDNYDSSMKKSSHFCVGGEPWGSITNNDEWLENILMRLDSFEGHNNFDFILGYFVHIIADIFDNIKIHIPFKDNFGKFNTPYKDYIEIFYNDKSQNDFALMEYYDWTGEVVGLLAGARGCDIPGVSAAAEAEAYRDLVFKKYSEGCVYHDPITFFPLSENINFIDATADEIYLLLTYGNIIKNA